MFPKLGKLPAENLGAMLLKAINSISKGVFFS